MFRARSLRPCWATQRNVKNQKTSATLHGNAPAPKKTSATLHGSAPAKKWSPKKGPKKRSKPFEINVFRCFFGERGAELTPSDLSATLHGNAIFGKNVKHTLVLPFTPRSRRGHAELSQGRPRPLPPDPQTTKREPYARRAFGKNKKEFLKK